MKPPAMRAQLHWVVALSDEQQRALSGSRQAFTARLVDGQPDDVFSVVLTFPPTARNGCDQEVDLTLLAPDRLPGVVNRLTPGCHLRIFRGSQDVAECAVIGIVQSAAAPGAA